MDDINHLRIHGAYCQTELGHGTNVQGVETTATLDKATDEIILHTPNIKATKFWPGELGLHANCPIVVAKLIVDGKDLGIQTFMARIRDRDHRPLPGISVGDVGPKFGYAMKDNGYLAFDNFRIPRTNMLMRYANLSPDGKLTL